MLLGLLRSNSDALRPVSSDCMCFGRSRLRRFLQMAIYLLVRMIRASVIARSEFLTLDGDRLLAGAALVDRLAAQVLP